MTVTKESVLFSNEVSDVFRWNLSLRVNTTDEQIKQEVQSISEELNNRSFSIKRPFKKEGVLDILTIETHNLRTRELVKRLEYLVDNYSVYLDLFELDGLNNTTKTYSVSLKKVNDFCSYLTSKNEISHHKLILEYIGLVES